MVIFYSYVSHNQRVSQSHLRPGPIIFRLRVAPRMPGVVAGHQAPAFKEPLRLEDGEP